MHLGMEFNDLSIEARKQAKTKPKSLLIKENIRVCFTELEFLKTSSSINMPKTPRLMRKDHLLFYKTLKNL